MNKLKIQNPIKKPTIYKTIVQVYFAIAICFVLFSTQNLHEELVGDGGVHPITAMFLVGTVLVVGLATFMGGVSFILLFFNKKAGVYLSIPSLSILVFLFGVSMEYYLQILSESNLIEIDRNLISTTGYVVMGLSSSIFISLFLAWKKINWK